MSTIVPVANVVFDTNGYREHVTGLSHDEVVRRFRALAVQERELGIRTMASPVAVYELGAHLAEPEDAAYEICKQALTAAWEHCREQDSFEMRLLADPDALLCRACFDALPDYLQQQGIVVPAICHLAATGTEGTQRELFRRLRKLVTDEEQAFVSDMWNFVKVHKPAATDWAALRDDPAVRGDLLRWLRSPQIDHDMAMLLVNKCASMLGRNVDQLNERARFLVAGFATPLRLVKTILERIVMSGCDMTSKNRANFLWDYHLCFQVGHSVDGGPLLLVTGDGAISGAASASGVGHRVMRLSDYVDAVQRGRVAVLEN